MALRRHQKGMVLFNQTRSLAGQIPGRTSFRLTRSTVHSAAVVLGTRRNCRRRLAVRNW
jgi:hypothetical protein